MADLDTTVRERRKAPNDTPSDLSEPKIVSPSLIKKEDSISTLDIIRSLVFLLLASSALSYFVTRESFVWGVKRPQWSRIEVVKAYLAGPKQYTDADLAVYDGTNPDLPILLAINGTIYDVSAGRKFYGPGGSYHFFAGRDASRGFITGCFKEDKTPDLRGVEMAFIPRDSEVDALYSKEELAELKILEREKAQVEAHKALKHWVDFFAKSRKYVAIGRVKREKGWEKKGPVPTLCRKAEEGRPTGRARPEGK